MSGVFILPCVCGEELIALDEDEMTDVARIHMEEHKARGEHPEDFA